MIRNIRQMETPELLQPAVSSHVLSFLLNCDNDDDDDFYLFWSDTQPLLSVDVDAGKTFKFPLCVVYFSIDAQDGYFICITL